MTVAPEIELVKAGLLYGDRVTLLSPITTMLLDVAALERFSPLQQIDLVRRVAPYLSNGAELAASEAGLDQLEDFLRRSARSASLSDRLLRVGLTRQLAPVKQILADAVGGIERESGPANLERQSRKKAATTAVESILRVWLEPFFAERDLRRITAQDVQDLMTMMEKGERSGPKAKGDRRYGRPVGAKSVRNYIGYLSALLGFAERKGLLPVNVARHIELPGKPESAEIRFLEPLEVRALADAAVDGPYREIDRAMYLTAAMTGLRQGELVALRWRDVDWTAGRIRVRQNYVLGEFGTPKSRRSTRSVPMADEVAGELDRLSRAAGESSGDALVFAGPHTAGPLDKAAIPRRFRRALKVAQLEQSRRFHDLRHTFGTAMAGTGVPMRTLQEWMGHRDIETTQRYADYSPSAHESAFVEAAFGRVASADRLAAQTT